MQVELSRFRVKPDCADIVEEWIAFLNDNMYWYTAQGEGGDAVENSEHWIDKKHIEYWQACIDKAYPAVDLASRVTMIPDRVRQLMR